MEPGSYLCVLGMPNFGRDGPRSETNKIGMIIINPDSSSTASKVGHICS